MKLRRTASIALLTALVIGNTYGTGSAAGNEHGNNDNGGPRNQPLADYMYKVSAKPILQFGFDDSRTGNNRVSNEADHGRDGQMNAVNDVKVRVGENNLGQAVEFMGTNSYISLPDLGKADAFTFSASVLLRDVQSKPVTTILDTLSEPGGVKLQFVHSGVPGKDGKNSTKLIFQVNGNAGGDVNDSGVQGQNDRYYEHEYTFGQTANDWTSHPGDHAWFDIGVVYKPAEKKVEFYYDGRLDKTAFFSTAVKPVLKGVRLGAGYNSGEYLSGGLDNIMIYNQALSAKDMEALASFEKDLWAVKEVDNWQKSKTILYVDGATGNDSNSGTKDSPFKTIKRGMDSITRDSTKLIINPGLYRESNLELHASGTVDKPIIIEAAVPGQTTITGSVPFTDWTATNQPNVFVHDWPYSWAKGTYQGNDIAKRKDMVIVDGSVLRPVLKMSKLDNNTYYLDEAQQKLFIRINKKIDKVDVEIPQAEKLLLSNDHQYIIMRGLNFENANPYLLDYGVDFGHSQHVLIEDTHFRNFSGMSFGVAHGSYTKDNVGNVPDVEAQDYVIRRSSFNDNGFDAAQLGYRSMNMLVEDSDLQRNGWRVEWGSYNLPDPAAIKMMFTKNITYRRLDISDNKIYGLWFDNQNWRIDVDNSYIAQNRDGMWAEINPQGVVIQNNTFFNNKNVGLNLANDEAAIIRNNIFYNFNGLNISNWEENEVRFDGNNANHINSGGPGTTSKNLRIQNNLFATGIPNSMMFAMQPWQVVYDTMQSSGNQYYSPTADHVYQYANKVTGFEEYMAAVHDTTSTKLSDNPFIDAGTTTVGFVDKGSVVNDSNSPLNIPVTLSKPLRKEVSVDYKIYNAKTKQLLDSGTLQFKPLQLNKVIYAGPQKDEVLVELVNSKDIKLGDQTLHSHVKDKGKDKDKDKDS